MDEVYVLDDRNSPELRIDVEQNNSAVADTVNCTACNKGLSTSKRKVFQHPRLSVILCRSCLKFLSTNDFSKDEDGIEEYCTWCGDGGNLVCCDFCEKAYCKHCVKRNLGKDFLKALLEAPDDSKWKCFFCDKGQITTFIDECKAVIDYIKSLPPISKDSENTNLNLNSSSKQLQQKSIQSDQKDKDVDSDPIVKENGPKHPKHKSTALSSNQLERRKRLEEVSKKVENVSTQRVGFKSSFVRLEISDDDDEEEVSNSNSVASTVQPVGQIQGLTNSTRNSEQEPDCITVKAESLNGPKALVANTTNLNGQVISEDVTSTKRKSLSSVLERLKNGTSETNLSSTNLTPDITKSSHDKNKENNKDKDKDKDISSNKIEKDVSAKTNSTKKSQHKGQKLSDSDMSDNHKKKKRTVLMVSSTDESDEEIVVMSKSGKRRVISKSLLKLAQAAIVDKDEKDEKKSKNDERPRKKPEKKTNVKKKKKRVSSSEPSSDEKSSFESTSDDEPLIKMKNKAKKTPNHHKIAEEENQKNDDIDEQQPGPSGIRPKNKLQRSKLVHPRHAACSESSEDDFITPKTGILSKKFRQKEENLGHKDLSDSERGLESHGKQIKGNKSDKLNNGKNRKEKISNDICNELENGDHRKKFNSTESIVNSVIRKVCARVHDIENGLFSITDTLDLGNPSNLDNDHAVEGAECDTLMNSSFEERDNSHSKQKMNETVAIISSGSDDDATSKNIERSEKDSDNPENEKTSNKQERQTEKAGEKHKKKKNDEELESDHSDETIKTKQIKKKLNNEKESEGDDSDNETASKIRRVKKRQKNDKESESDSDHRGTKEVGKQKSNNESENEDSDNEILQLNKSKRVKKKQTNDKESDSDDKQKSDKESENEDSDEETLKSNKTKRLKKKQRTTKAKISESDNSDNETLKETKKKKIMEDDSDDEPLEETKKKQEKVTLDGSDSDVPIRRQSKRKIVKGSSDNSDKSSNGASKKKRKTKVKKKRRVIQNDSDDNNSESSDNEDEDEDEDDDDLNLESESSSSDGSIIITRKSKRLKDSDSKKDKKKSKRKRKKKGSNDETGSDKGSDKGSNKDDDEENDEETTPSKGGRKKIRRIMKDKELDEETVKAQKAEEERRKRLRERAKAERDQITVAENVVEGDFVLEKDEEKKPLVVVSQEINQHLKPHQRKGIQFMYDCLIETIASYKKEDPGGGCLLAHCMGLGKTLQVVTLVHTLMNNPNIKMTKFLVVCPLNTVLNWESEFDKWIPDEPEEEKPDVFVLSYCNGLKERAYMLKDWFNRGGILITGYEMYRNLVQGNHMKSKKMKTDAKTFLCDPGPDIVVCDEGHILKNDATAISKAMNSIKTRRRVVLTGTPLQNNLLEYHCMVDFVKPKLLGTRKEYQNRFVNPILNGQCANSTSHDVRVMKQRCHVLYQLLAGCVQRQDYSVLTPFLPQKREYTIFVRLGEKQIKLYEHYLEEFVYLSGSGGNCRSSLFSNFQCLSRIWCHPWCLHIDRVKAAKRDRYKSDDEFIDDEESEESEESDDDKPKPWGADTSSDDDAKEKKRRKQRRAADSSGSSSSNDDEPKKKNETSSTRNTRASRATRSQMQNGTNDKDNGSKGSDSDEEITTVQPNIDVPKERGSLRSGINFKDGAKNPDREEEEEYETTWFDKILEKEDEMNVELGGKLVLLLEILANAEAVGDKILVFSQSLTTLDLIEKALNCGIFEGDQLCWVHGVDYFRMDGSTPVSRRKRWADIFNDPENTQCRLFLISTRAGSLGINMVGANRVIVFDCSWNPSHDVQSVFRVYRFGQDKPVYVYRFVSQGTMEEKIYGRQITKLATSGRVVDEQQIGRHFTDEEIRELYTFSPEKIDEDNKETPQLPKDPLLAEVLQRLHPKFIVRYHEHDLLLENKEEEKLSEEERKLAWKNYEDEKSGVSNVLFQNFQQQRTVLPSSYQNQNANLSQYMNQVQIPGFQRQSYTISYPPEMTLEQRQQALLELRQREVMRLLIQQRNQQTLNTNGGNTNYTRLQNIAPGPVSSMSTTYRFMSSANFRPSAPHNIDLNRSNVTNSTTMYPANNTASKTVNPPEREGRQGGYLSQKNKPAPSYYDIT